jgi:predicted flap endonuclease-1-like 5' DNA nuclease
MVSLVKVEGIGVTYARKLQEIGITTTENLLKVGSTPQGRKTLAEQSGISEKLILRWVNQVDLYRINGVGEKYADLLEGAGVDTVPELAQRNPENLYQKILEVNLEKQLVRRLPSQVQVSDWVAQAKTLPRVITY